MRKSSQIRLPLAPPSAVLASAKTANKICIFALGSSALDFFIRGLYFGDRYKTQKQTIWQH
jgi:hypothetical protein